MAIPDFDPPVTAQERPSSSSLHVDLGGLSHPGKVRQNNEDHFLVARFDRSMRALFTNLDPGHIPDRYGETGYAILVADGMGGEAAGEVASDVAISSLVDLALRTPDWIMRIDQDLARELLARMDKRIGQLEDILRDKVRVDPSLSGMGSTMTIALSLGTRVGAAAMAGSCASALVRETSTVWASRWSSRCATE